jgi:hypothetical protein
VSTYRIMLLIDGITVFVVKMKIFLVKRFLFLSIPVSLKRKEPKSICPSQGDATEHVVLATHS